MKRLFITLVLFFAMTSSIFAAPTNPVTADLDAATREAEAMIPEGKQLDTEFAALKAEKDNIIWVVDAHKKMVRDWKAEKSALDSEYSIIIQEGASYKSNCAGRTFYEERGERAQYEACNSAQSSLRSKVSAYDSKAEHLRTMATKIDEIGRNNTENTTKWAAKQKDYNARQADFAARKAKMIEKLSALVAKYDACDKAIASGSKEDMKAICGMTFDGNTSQPNKNHKPQKGGLTVTPNK